MSNGTTLYPLSHIDIDIGIFYNGTVPHRSLRFLVDCELLFPQIFRYPNIHERYVQHLSLISFECQHHFVNTITLYDNCEIYVHVFEG